MQDLADGSLKPIDPRFLEMLSEQQPGESPFSRIGELNEKLQAAKDAAIPQRERQGPIFSTGEILTIRGGRFRVHAITDKRIYLDSLPLAESEPAPEPVATTQPTA